MFRRFSVVAALLLCAGLASGDGAITGTTPNEFRISNTPVVMVGDWNEDNANTTTTANGQFGLQAQWGSYVAGRLGTLTGTSGGLSFTHNANDDLTP